MHFQPFPHCIMGRGSSGNAAANPTARSRGPRPRLPSSGSFHAGDIIPSIGAESHRRARSSIAVRRDSAIRYHTFETPPPKTPSENPDASRDRGLRASFSSDESGDSASDRRRGHSAKATPLPRQQLLLLALISLCEQTALNSISPYLPDMVRSFPEIPEAQSGLYVGLIASAFALAQLVTNFLWGHLSDSIGRKPVMLAGTFLLGVCFVFFGFCTKYWQLVLVHVAMGLLNGNAAVVPTCLGEVTDRSNQSFAFTWLPVMYSIGGITGPALGGLLVGQVGETYRFLAPNVCAAVLLFVSVIVLAIWFEETLDSDDRAELHHLLARLGSFCLCGGRNNRSRNDSHSPDMSSDDEEESQLLSQEASHSSSDDNQGPSETTVIRQLLNRRTVLVLLTYLMFQLVNISFNSLFPIFASASAPTGRSLSPEDVGLLLSFSGFATIIFQCLLFQSLKAKLGNLGTYQGALLGLGISMMLMPWVGHLDDAPLFNKGSARWWLYAEMASVLVIKNICAVGGLSSVLLLITNSAPSHETLGTLNGIAQTLSAAGRSFGPFLSGALFTLSSRLKFRGELLAWGVFGAFAFIGWFCSLTIKASGLESADREVGDHDDEAQGQSST